MDSDGLLPASRVFAMWQNAEREWSRPALGLTAAGQVPFGACEVMDYLMASSATVADAVSQLGDYLALLTRATRFEVHDRRERPYCQMIWRIQPRDVMFHQRDFSLALAADRVFHLSGHRPVCVELLGPPLASGRQYADRFGAEVALRAKRNALTYSRAAWTSALPARDQMLNRMLRRHAQLLLDRQPVSERATIAEQVRAVLLRSSRVGIASIEEVARALATSPRTLQRRLRVEGVRFDTLSENVRASCASVSWRPGAEHQRGGLPDRVLRIERVLARVSAMDREDATSLSTRGTLNGKILANQRRSSGFGGPAFHVR
jgi:AraC-like DNA-binding protein